jgi:hypothetical protein
MESFVGIDLHKYGSQLAVLRENKSPSQLRCANGVVTVEQVLEELPEGSKIVLHRNMPCTPESFLKAIAPYRENIAVGRSLKGWDRTHEVANQEDLICFGEDLWTIPPGGGVGAVLFSKNISSIQPNNWD